MTLVSHLGRIAAAIPGAVAGAEGVPLHVGGPIAEQRRLRAGAPVLLARDVLRLTGPDALTWLDSITSQAIADLAPGASTETLVLSPEGRIEHVLRLHVDEAGALWVIVDAGTGDALERWLTMMRFYRQVEIERPEVVVIGSFAEPAGPTAWIDAWPHVQPGGVRYGEPTGEPWQWSEAVLSASAASAIAPSAFVGTLSVDALRIAAGRPGMPEIDERTIPHELDWLTTAVHLSKGCYRGQETIAKVHNLGAPPRRLVLLHLDGSESAQVTAGDDVLLDGGTIGSVTSAAVHDELGPVALAIVKRQTVPDAPLAVRTGDGTEVAASQQVLVPPSAGHAHRPPRLPRLGAVRRPTA